MFRHTTSDLLVGQRSSAADNEWHPSRPNCDKFTVSAFDRTDEPSTITTLAAVAHGFGASRNGKPDVAAELTMSTLIETFEQAPTSDVVPLLYAALNRASETIARYDETLAVVCSAAVVANGKLYIASCGNCRVILVRAGHAVQVAAAHAMMDMLVEEGHATWEDLSRGPQDPPPTLSALGAYATEPFITLGPIMDAGTPNRQVLEAKCLPLLAYDRIVLLSNKVFGNGCISKKFRLGSGGPALVEGVVKDSSANN